MGRDEVKADSSVRSRSGIRPVRTFTLFAAAAFLLSGPTVLAQDRPSSKRVGMRGPRASTRATPLDVDVDSLRLRAETADGVLVVYDAAVHDGETTECSGYLVYWQPLDSEDVQVYGSVVENQGDLAVALLSLERDLGVDIEALEEYDERLTKATKTRGPRPGRVGVGARHVGTCRGDHGL